MASSCWPSRRSTQSTTCKRDELKSVNAGSGRRRKYPSLQDQFVKTNLDIFLIGIFIALYNNYGQLVDAAGDDPTGGNATHTNTTDDTDHTIGTSASTVTPYAVLLPWFVQIISVIIYYVITRYLPSLPYTALVFILGGIIGFLTTGDDTDAIAKSAKIWLGINGQVILLVFLPGLIFLDSYTINVHLFFQTFWQLISFAFPMVLVGAALTAVFAKYAIRTVDWSWSLCMTFGAILSGTDPVAVSGLLTSLGAPPRLNMHVSGESLLNDGSTVVLYQIFTALYYYEFGIHNFGNDIGWGEGIKLFFQLAFGGVAIGLAFGFVTVLFIYLLNRRLSAEENVIQVVTTVCSAYLTYFVAEILCNSSGIISTLVCGLTVKVLGTTMINDSALTLHFWQVTGQLLNTLLFALGGLLWGNIISTNIYSPFDIDASHTFNGQDWGYLVLLYLYLIVLRFFLVFAFYPLTARIGLGTNTKEAVFMSYAGFRGAVGIALSLSLWANVMAETEQADSKFDKYRDDVELLFGFVGGIALLTLFINGITSGPLLFWLGLVTPQKAKDKVVENHRQQMIHNTLVSYVGLLSQGRFRDLDFYVVKKHVPFLSNITYEQLMKAVKEHKNNTPSYLYELPNIDNVVSYLDGSRLNQCSNTPDKELEEDSSKKNRKASKILIASSIRSVCFPENEEHTKNDSYDEELEERLNFIETLRCAYHRQIELGELEEQGDVPYSLFQSLDFAENAATAGTPLNDWAGTQVASDTWVSYADKVFQTFVRRLGKGLNCSRKGTCIDLEFFSVYLRVRQALAFIRAHRLAQKIFKEQFTDVELTPTELMVIAESENQIKLAISAMKELDQMAVDTVTSHFACHILLNISVNYVERLAAQELIPEKEASELLEQLDECVGSLLECRKLGCRKARKSVLFEDTGIEVEASDLSSPLLEQGEGQFVGSE